MITVLYHGNCYDGFGAAWAAWKKLGEEGVRYQAVIYGDQPPPLINADQGKLYILDFSFPRNQLIALTKEFDLTVLDHHKTAKDDLANLQFATFDLEKSGAMLAWEHFHATPPPVLVQFLEDRDLWRFKLPASRAISTWMRSWPFDFHRWNQLEFELDRNFGSCRLEGEAIFRFQSQMVALMADNAWQEEIEGHLVPVTNATAFFSEVGEELCLRNAQAPFSAYYLDRKDGKRQWGLRSRGGFDCSEVAKKMGGGGHPGAAGWVEERP